MFSVKKFRIMYFYFYPEEAYIKSIFVGVKVFVCCCLEAILFIDFKAYFDEWLLRYSNKNNQVFSLIIIHDRKSAASSSSFSSTSNINAASLRYKFVLVRLAEGRMR